MLNDVIYDWIYTFMERDTRKTCTSCVQVCAIVSHIKFLEIFRVRCPL